MIGYILLGYAAFSTFCLIIWALTDMDTPPEQIESAFWRRSLLIALFPYDLFIGLFVLLIAMMWGDFKASGLWDELKEFWRETKEIWDGE